MTLQADGRRKYPDSKLLTSSSGREWSTLHAELRSHPSGTITSALQENTEILIVIRGTGDGRVYRKRAGEHEESRPIAGTIWVAPAAIVGEEILLTAPVPKILHLFLSARQLDQLADRYHLSLTEVHSVRYVGGINDELIYQLGLAVLRELNQETSTTRLFIEISSLMLAAHLAHIYSDGGYHASTAPPLKRLDDERLRRVLDYIEVNLEQEITVGRLADSVGLSNFHFTRMFTAAVGMPPYRYVSQLRLERARALLSGGKLPISQIAHRMRFSSVTSFHRAFLRSTGLTPGEYRRLSPIDVLGERPTGPNRRR